MVLSANEARAAMQTLDADHNGRITPGELLKVVAARVSYDATVVPLQYVGRGMTRRLTPGELLKVARDRDDRLRDDDIANPLSRTTTCLIGARTDVVVVVLVQSAGGPHVSQRTTLEPPYKAASHHRCALGSTTR